MEKQLDLFAEWMAQQRRNCEQGNHSYVGIATWTNRKKQPRLGTHCEHCGNWYIYMESEGNLL